MPLTNVLHYKQSVFREAIVEHKFLADLLGTYWKSRTPAEIDVAKPAIDNAGYDLILEARGVIRHVQLKSSVGQAKHVPVNRLLEEKPSGCVLWIHIDTNLNIRQFLWFGNPPGEPIPPVSAYPKSSGQRHKVPKRVFEPLGTIEQVIERLFGSDSPSPIGRNRKGNGGSMLGHRTIDFGASDFVVQIWQKHMDDGLWYHSTGSVVGPHFVITAAHCVVEEVECRSVRVLKESCVEDVCVYFGRRVRAEGGNNTNERRCGRDIEWIRMFPHYNTRIDGSGAGFLYDLALIKFCQPIRTSSVRVIAPGEFQSIADGSPARLYGFGAAQAKLRRLDAVLVKDPKNGDRSFYNRTTLAIHAGSQPGDSGGPLLVETETETVQIGVLSQGKREEPGGSTLGLDVCAQLGSSEVATWFDAATQS